MEGDCDWPVSCYQFLIESNRKKPPDFRENGNQMGLVGSFAVGLKFHRDFIIEILTVKSGIIQQKSKSFFGEILS